MQDVDFINGERGEKERERERERDVLLREIPHPLLIKKD